MKREMTMTRGEMRLYLTGNASVWVGKTFAHGKNMRMVSRFTEEADYTCEYDGEDLGDGFCTHDVDEALDWLFGVRKSNYQKHYFYFASGDNVKSICFYTSEDAWEFVKEYADSGYDCVVERYI